MKMEDAVKREEQRVWGGRLKEQAESSPVRVNQADGTDQGTSRGLLQAKS
jgi:hypothetical protein